MDLRPGPEPITDDDAAIAAALEDVSVPALLMSLVHLTGSADVLDELPRPAGIYLNEVQGFMSPEDQATVRARAVELIAAWRDAGCVVPPPPDAATVHRMMQVMVAEEVPAEYVPLLMEELELDGADARRAHGGPSIDPVRAADLHVVVVGAGMSGVLAAIRLAEDGIPFTVVEKNPGVGGTWWENRYPGCRVDVGNHFYCYSFAPNDSWSEFFSRAPELQEYFERCARDAGVLENVRFSTEVVAADWDDDACRWAVTVRGPDGTTEVLRADAVISAVGQLNRPRIPDVPGRDTFTGPQVHSAAWDPALDLTGKRVAVVGTGASAFQLVPAIAGAAAHVTVFQRSAPWMFPNPHYHDTVAPGVRWALRHLPAYDRWYRLLIFWPACDGGLPAMRIDPDWPHQDRSVNELNDAAREFFTQWIVDQCGDDTELAAKVVPDYVCLGKRTLQDNGSWLAALRRDDVDLVAHEVVEVTPTGVVDGTGAHHEVDVIVWCTGFHANRYLWPMEITGRDGRVLSEVWGERPTAHLGITVPGFPNLFCLYGPGTNLAHGGSLIFHSECQVRYVMGCLAELVARGGGALEVRPAAHDDWVERTQAELDRMVWSHPSIRHSWYRNDEGRIYVLSPWRLLDYWRWTREPDPADLELRARTSAAR
ncbi:MAG: flavin-containing monooxygenase [Microthrixaceae bacterium]